VQHPVGDHALLADGRTAALIAPDGNVAWMCWPRVDSAPLFFSILDEERGGAFTVRPAAPAAQVVSRGYHPHSLVLETTWQAGSQRLIVDDALGWNGPPRLARRLTALGDAVEVEARFDPAFDWGNSAIHWRVDNHTLTGSAGATSIMVTSPGAWNVSPGRAISRFSLDPASGSATLVFQNTQDRLDASAGDDLIESTLDSWRRALAGAPALRFAPTAVRVLDESALRDLAVTSAAVLVGLRQRGGGIVAAPTTSLPQWPHSSRTWDYRYCWLRDASLAGDAFIRLGLIEHAAGLGAFLGGVIEHGGLRPVVRVDGGDAPDESELSLLHGYRGARPVRSGNAASSQLQIDVAGEVIQFAATLFEAGALPVELATATRRLAAWLVDHWHQPDYGIWEIRGAPRHYTHSRVMAWAGLNSAANLVERGAVDGDAITWRRCARAIRAAVVTNRGAALELHAGGGGADAALTMCALTGFLAPDDPSLNATLELIAGKLDRDGLLDRYEGQPDGLPDPCAPFVFPSLWMAMAQAMSLRESAPYLSAALGSRSQLGLWGEVAQPDDHSPFGNYPQVQSHASFVLATVEPRLSPRS
jgi:GH15 family glucan-1,4-alpha-glucosidase